MMTIFERQVVGFLLLVATVLLIWAYFSPVTYKEKIDAGVDWTKGLFNKDTPCPSDYVPVCANETTYANACLATRAGKTIYEEGECVINP
jgi:hypothetical protein